MGFFIELLARRRTDAARRYRRALSFLESLSPAERADMGIKPADFPRIARDMAAREKLQSML